jgi:hypothetical protein
MKMILIGLVAIIAAGFLVLAVASGGKGIAGLGLLFVCVWFYFLPAILAWNMGHRQLTAITLLNLFAGWTLIGWVGALVWTYTKPAEATNVR